MGFLDKLFGGSSKSKKCAWCKAQDTELPIKKRFDKETYWFCSKECSRQFRIDRKKEKKNPPQTGTGLPW